MSADAQPLFACHDLRVEVPARVLVDALNLELRPGEVLAVLGQNGSGKTLTLHTLAGLRPAAAGRSELQGQDVAHADRKAIARSLALMPQHIDDIFPATVLDTAMIGRHPHIGRFDWQSTADGDIAEAAPPRADRTHQHKRGRSSREALSHIGASRVLADRIQLQLLQQTPHLAGLCTPRMAHTNPRRLPPR